MAKQVPGFMLLHAAIGQANLAQQSATTGRDAQAMVHLATAVQQIAAGLKEALQEIYEEVD